MSRKPIVKRLSAPVNRNRTDWSSLDALGDKEIEADVRSDPDAAPVLDDEWSRKARLVRPKPREQGSLSLDRDVLDWFKAQGPGYQSRMSTVLREHMIAHKRRTDEPSRPDNAPDNQRWL